MFIISLLFLSLTVLVNSNNLRILINEKINCSISQLHIAQGSTPTSMTISWITKYKCISYVLYGRQSNNLDYIVHGSSSIYNFTYNLNNYQSNFIHHVYINNLQPDTSYFYKCGTQNQHPKIFNTLPNVGVNKIITFGIIGDLGQTQYSLSTINNILDAVNNNKINMILHAGDLSYADCNQTLWDTYGNLIEPLAGTTPWMVGAGNHEIEFNGTDYTSLFNAFEKRYKMPCIKEAVIGEVSIKSAINPHTNMPYCTPSIFQVEYNYGNSFFSFDSGLAHIIFLNPYTNTSETSIQYTWLLDNLKNTNRDITPWVIVIMHCPWYNSNMNHYSDLQTIMMRESMEYLFFKYNVNIAFSGHVHAYERTYPVYQNNTSDFGTVYITVGDGGNLEGLDNNYYEAPSWSAYRNGTQYGYGTLTIYDKKRMLWKWYKNEGPQIIPRDSLFLCNSIYGNVECL